MQRYLTSPDDPESEADIQMQIMISQAAVDSKGFEVLVPQSVESVKRHHATLSSRIAALTARLSLESKIREAAQSLLKLHADNKKLARQASDHLEAANRKVDQVATELWKLTQLAADLQRTLLQHTSGVLALGVVRLEDQSRREREVYALQLQEARVGKDVEDQFESMSRTIMSLESDTLEAQLLLEDKDRTIERLMKQLDHQRDLYVRLDEQQQKMMALSHSQQKDLDLLDKSRNDAKTVAELESLLSKVVGSLQGILQQQQQQQQQYRHQKQLSTATTTTGRTKIDAIDNNNNNNSNSEDHQHKHRKDYNKRDRSDQTWSSDSTLLSKRSSPTTQDLSVKTGPACEDSMSSSTQDSNISDRTANSAQGSTLANDKSDDIAEAALQHVSRERIFSTLDALDRFMTESQQKSQILEDELGLLRRQSVVLSESRNNSIKIKNFSSMRGQAAEETIRSALEKSLKDALLEKEIARQELENERQRWQDDQNHRISALEESLVAVEDNEKSALDAAGTDGDLTTQEDIILTLRVQLQEAIDEIDTLSQQQQSSLKSMRQLFALIPDSRRKSNLQSGSISSMSSGNVTVGFSMETLILRIKELVARSQQLEQDSSESKHPRNSQSTTSSRQTSHQGAAPSLSSQADAIDNQQQQDSTWVSNSELERLQANAGMIQLLEKEIELLKQHTDMLLDENARLAEMAAASATAVSHTPSRSSADLRAMIRPPSIEDALDELHEIIRVKDILLRERDLLVEQQEKALLKVRAELAQATEQQTRAAVTPQAHATSGVSPGSPLPPLSSFDVAALEDFRVQCDKLEEQNGEMRMIIAALEVTHGGPGSGAQLLKALQSANTPSSSNSTTTSWLSSRLGAAGSLSFGSLTQKLSPEPTTSSSAINTPIPSSVDAFSNNNAQFSQHQQQQSVTGTLSGGSNAAITSATAALRKEFRRVMAELREEKEKAVRKEVEERRRLERTVRQLRRELQAVQNSEMTTA
ncbi:hypothetical protein BGZ47_002982 [Haplosporangium gracile]|nr:hypothetical protein BGZ47_002982 [Haplosporangium gracile]